MAHGCCPGRGRLPQRWAIDAAPATSMGHRCGCPAWLNSIDGPSLRSAGPAGRGPGERSRGGKSRGPGSAGTGACLPAAVTLTLCAPAPHRCGRPGRSPMRFGRGGQSQRRPMGTAHWGWQDHDRGILRWPASRGFHNHRTPGHRPHGKQKPSAPASAPGNRERASRTRLSKWTARWLGLETARYLIIIHNKKP